MAITFHEAIDTLLAGKELSWAAHGSHKAGKIILNTPASRRLFKYLYELLGNLLENAFKWCNKKVSVTTKQINEQTQITIEDDGPGINENEKKRILLRGQRADQNTPGHGLGLAMVNNILLLYKGEMKITNSGMGGAKIIINL